jgi:cytochrome c-type biogenesis protein CcmH
VRSILAILVVAIAIAAGAEQSVQTPDISGVVGPPKSVGMNGATLDTKTSEIASELRCPVCQGMSINDSPAPMAINMKHQVRDLLARGYDRSQILDYFESSYGEFVRLQPRFRGVDALVWTVPPLALILGLFVVARSARRLRNRQPLPETDDPYLASVRDLVRGEERDS